MAGARGEPPECGRLRRDRPRPTHLGHSRERAPIGGRVGADDDVGVEDAQERLEVAGS